MNPLDAFRDDPSHGSNAIEYRPAGDHNCNPARGVLFDDPSHGSNAIEYRPAGDRNCNPARGVFRDDPSQGATPSSTGPQGIATATRPGVCCSMIPGSNAIEYRPAADHNCNPARGFSYPSREKGSSSDSDSYSMSARFPQAMRTECGFPAGPSGHVQTFHPFGNSSDLGETFFSASMNYGFS